MTRFKIYVAGPYTKGDKLENTRRAIGIADGLFHFGFAPFVPHLSHFWESVTRRPYEYEDWMELDLAWVSAADLVFRIDGESPGADREIAYAEQRGIPVVYSISEAVAVRTEIELQRKVATGITFVGPGQGGKDTASQMFAEITGLPFICSTSAIIGESFASECGSSLEDLMVIRHANRDAWRARGDALRVDDQAALVRACRDKGAKILNGIRSRIEITAAKREGLTGLVVWIERPGIPNDPTLEFGPEVSDHVLFNDRGLDELRSALSAIARQYGFPIA